MSGPGEPAQTYPALGSAPTPRRSSWAGLTFTRARSARVIGIVVLVVTGSVLPYLSMPFINYATEPDVFRGTLFPAATFVRGIDPLWLPGYTPGPETEQIQLALTLFNLGPSLQQIGAVVGVLSAAALFQDEINKFFWWPLHLSGWLLALSIVPLFIGVQLLRAAEVDLSLGAGWLPLALAGVLIGLVTVEARSRIDTYASI